jgi:hypothetical protein
MNELPHGGVEAAVPEGGTYSLVVQAPGRWWVTVVHRAPAGLFEPHTPEVDPLPDAAQTFAEVRRLLGGMGVSLPTNRVQGCKAGSNSHSRKRR